MLEVWSWPTPNGHKVHIALEELGLAVQGHPGQYRRRRPVQARIPQDHPQPPHPGDRRFRRAGRQAVHPVRIGGDHDLPVGKDRRQADPERPDRPLQMPRMDDVPDGRRRPDVRPVEPFRRLRGRKDPLCDRALHQRGEAPAPGARASPGGVALARRRRVQHGRHHHLPVDPRRRAAQHRSRRIPVGQALARRDRGAAGGAARGRGLGRTPARRARSPTTSARTISAGPSSPRAEAVG